MLSPPAQRPGAEEALHSRASEDNGHSLLVLFKLHSQVQQIQTAFPSKLRSQISKSLRILKESFNLH